MGNSLCEKPINVPENFQIKPIGNNTMNTEIQETTTSENVKLITSQNPTPEEMSSIINNIKVNYNFEVDVKPVDFKFKKTKDKDTGIVIERETVQLAVPYPSVQGIINILERGGKELDLLRDAVEQIINAAARDLLYDDVSLTAANFPVEKLSWEYIANLPKTQRGGGIAKETWDDFIQDYIEIMPSVTGKTIEAVSNAANILKGKLNQVKTNKPVLNLLVDQLAIYAEHSPNAADYVECVEFLLSKADNYLNLSSEELLANL